MVESIPAESKFTPGDRVYIVDMRGKITMGIDFPIHAVKAQRDKPQDRPYEVTTRGEYWPEYVIGEAEAALLLATNPSDL